MACAPLGMLLTYVACFDRLLHDQDPVAIAFVNNLRFLGGIFDRALKIRDLVHHFELKRLLAGPDLAVGDGPNVFHLHLSTFGHGADELAVHVVDERLQVLLLGGSHVARGVAGVFEQAGFHGDILQLGPLQQFAIVDGLRNYANRADNAALIGVNLVGRRGNVVSAAGADGLDGSNNALLLLVADALDLAVNLFRRSHAAARRVHVDDDGLDGVIVGEFLQLLHDDLGRKNHALEIHYSDLVAKAGERGLAVIPVVHGDVDQREDGENEEKKRSATNKNPEPNP